MRITLLLAGVAWLAGRPALGVTPRHESFTLYSLVLAERRTINVYTPPEYAAAPGMTFPVLYVLDGALKGEFVRVATTVDSLIRRGRIPATVVIGIANTERSRDLSSVTSDPADIELVKKAGGSGSFRTFLRDELLPEVKRRYRGNDETTLVGVSFAGLFVVETLFKEPSLFHRYIALSPSLWWDGGEIVLSAEERVAGLGDAEHVLYLSAADEPRIAGRTAALAAILKARARPSLTWYYEPRPDLTHFTIYDVMAATAFERVLGAPHPAQSAVAPKVFAEGIVSTGHEFAVTFAPDGREVLFTRSFPETRRAHVMSSVQQNGQWATATRLPFSDDAYSDLDPALSPDGNRLFFVSTRPAPGRVADSLPNMEIWYVDRAGTGWGTPQWIPALGSPGKEGSPTVDRAGNICFFSDRGGHPGDNAIYCAARNTSGWDAPVRLEATVNAGPSDTSPFLAPDGNTLLFYSTRAGGLGAADVYASVRQHGAWQAAVNLGAPVNTEAFEYNPSVSRDGKTLYFGRDRKVWEVPLEALPSRVLRASQFQ